MTRNVPLLRGAALGALLFLAACSGTTDFTVKKTFDVNSAGGTAVYTSVQQVDLPADAPDAWKHRNKIKKLELVGLEAVMTNNITGVATTGSGSVLLRPDGGGADVTVGSWTNEAISAAAPDSINATLTPGAVGLIEDALRSNGRFQVVFSGSTVDALHFVTDVTLHVKLTYKVP